MRQAEAYYYTMVLIRRTEETFLDLFSKGLLNGTVHTCIGQEACSVGVMQALDRDRDVIFASHRAHGHYLAYSDDLEGLIAEVMGKSKGVCGGVGGSQHLHKGNFYTNGVQGGIVPCATGAALAEKMRGGNAIVTVFLGDGTMGEGVVYECLNIAALWKLPMLFVLEDNRYAQTTPKELAHAGSLAERARPFGIRSRSIVASDVFAVASAATEAVEFVRQKREPYFLHLETYRFSPHSKGDDFRAPAEIERYRERDPLGALSLQVEAEKASLMRSDVEKRITDTVTYLSKSAPLDERMLERILDLA